MDLYAASLDGAEWLPSGGRFEWAKIPGMDDAYALRDPASPDAGTLRGYLSDMISAGVCVHA